MSDTALAMKVCLVAAILAIGGCSGAEGGGEGDAADRPLILDTMDVAEARIGEIEDRLTVVGDLEPYRVVTLSAQVPGTLATLAVDRGTRVRRGQTLAVIEAEGIRGQAAGAEAAVAAAEANVALARQQLESARMLHEAGAISDLDLEGARTGHEAAVAQLAGARAQAASAAEAARRATIRAPMDGVVSARMVEVGEPINPGQAVLTVVDLEYLELRAQLAVANATRVRPGMPVVFELEAYPDRTFSGAVDRVEPTADPDTRQVGVYMRLPNSDRSLVGGLFARGWIVLGNRAGVLTVPEDAVRDGTTGPHVLVITGGQIHSRPVTPGLADPAARRVEIQNGLAPGDTVVVIPGATAPEGTPVRFAGPVADGETS